MPTAEALLAETRWLTRLANDLVGDPHAAEDVVQDTLLAALDEQRRGPIQRLRPWLRTVARNLTFRRRQRDQLRTQAEQKSGEDQEEALPSAAEAVERASVHSAVVEAVLGLPEPYRSTIVLRYLESLSIAEVADRTGVSVEAARTRQKRGIAMLRQRLDSLYDGDRQAWGLTLLPSTPTSTFTCIPTFTSTSASTPAAAAPTAPTVPTAVTSSGAGDVIGKAIGSGVAKVAGSTGILIMTMTTKAKLAAVAVVCGVVSMAFWGLQVTGEDGFPEPTEAPGGGRLVAEGEARDAAGALVAPASKDPARRTETPRQLVAKPTRGSLLVRAIWATDKKPAAGVILRTRYIWPGHKDEPLFNRRSGTTDKNGTLRFEGLWPAPLYVGSFRGLGTGQKVQIKPGKEARVLITVPAGLNLDGIVVDRSGNPVAGADLIVAPDGVWGPGAAAIAKSDRDGRFHLRDLRSCYIGARARGHAPSPLHSIRASKGSNLTVRIVLGGRGGGVCGRVLDPLGKPVHNAVLQVGRELAKHRIKLPDGGFGMLPLPVFVRTDRTGQFQALGLAPGRRQVAVRAKGLAPWFGTVDVVTHGDSELLVNLLPAATLTGTVRDGSGRPLARVGVHSNSGHVFGDRGTATDAGGNYRLEDLGPGKMKVVANSREFRAQAELTVLTGQTLEWNPVLAKGLELRGLVRDEKNEPVPGAYVYARLQHPGKIYWTRSTKTDTEGRFTIQGCLPAKTIRITVQDPAFIQQTVFVKPDQEDLVVRVQSLGKPSAFIIGQVLDPDGKAVAECAIYPIDLRTHTSRMRTPEVGTGRFKYGPCRPGEYRVKIEAKGYPTVLTEPKTLKEGETWDLGVIRMQRPGFVQVKLGGETSLLPKDCLFLVQDAAKRTFDDVRITNGKAERSSPLAPGTYYLQVLDRKLICNRHRFEIRAGQETHLDVPLEKGIPVMLEFVVKNKDNDEPVGIPRGWILAEIRDNAGRMILTRAASPFGTSEYLRRLEFAVRPGRYKVTARTTAIRAHAEATLTVGKKPAAPKRIVLR